MGLLGKAAGSAVLAVTLVACATPDPFALKTLPKGEQLNVSNILAAHPDKRACVDYQAATNSCASIITSTVRGNTMISREIAAVKVPGTTQAQPVEVITRSSLRGDQACVRSQDISVIGKDEFSGFLLEATRAIVDQFGGSVCGTYYRSGDGYVVSSIGANGQPVPPGDVQFQFITGDAKLRAQ